MDTTIQAGARPARNPRQESRATRGLRLYEERGHEIEYVDGTYRVPDSENAAYTINPGHEYCSCPDRISPCKHLYAATVAEAKRRCRTRRSADRPKRRRAEMSRSPRKNTDDRRRRSGRARRNGSLRGVLCGPDAPDRIVERLGV